MLCHCKVTIKPALKGDGCFRKWWYPQIIHFNRVFHYEPSILGYPYFWKHPDVFFVGSFSLRIVNCCKSKFLVAIQKKQNYWVVASNLFFYLYPTWGDDPIWRAYFSKGLKPPTSKTQGSSPFSVAIFCFNTAWWRIDGLKRGKLTKIF